MASKQSFTQRWQRDHGARPRLTPLHILIVTATLGALLLLVENRFLDREALAFEAYAQRMIEENGEVYPPEVYVSDWVKPVPEVDLVHLGLLHEACMNHKESVIPWTYGQHGAIQSPSALVDRNDPDLYEKMRECPDVDIFLPLGIRGHGYCEDAIGYTKDLQSRMLPAWALEVEYIDKATGNTYGYHDLCPSTPMIFLNHYFDGVTEKPEWPKDKPVYMMPNIEMYELAAEHYWRADVVLCKTAVCARRVRMWYQQEGNPKNTMVMYTRHTSSDVATLARVRLGADAIKPKDFSDVRFFHAVGTSASKGTSRILDCWLSRPDFPKVDIYMDENVYNGDFKKRYEKPLAKMQDRVSVHVGRVLANDFGKMVAETAFFLCTSLQEGYGHYINQARANGALIVTTNLAPMNELVSPTSGVMVAISRIAAPEQLLGGRYHGEHGLKGVEGITAYFDTKALCGAVEDIVKMSVTERQERAERARVHYFIDTNFFAARMNDLRAYAQAKRRNIRVGVLTRK